MNDLEAKLKPEVLTEMLKQQGTTLPELLERFVVCGNWSIPPAYDGMQYPYDVRYCLLLIKDLTQEVLRLKGMLDTE